LYRQDIIIRTVNIIWRVWINDREIQ